MLSWGIAQVTNRVGFALKQFAWGFQISRSTAPIVLKFYFSAVVEWFPTGASQGGYEEHVGKRSSCQYASQTIPCVRSYFSFHCSKPSSVTSPHNLAVVLLSSCKLPTSCRTATTPEA